MSRLVRILSVIALLLAAGSATAAERGFTFKSYMLENGLQVVVFPNKRAPIVTSTASLR